MFGSTPINTHQHHSGEEFMRPSDLAVLNQPYPEDFEPSDAEASRLSGQAAALDDSPTRLDSVHYAHASARFT